MPVFDKPVTIQKINEDTEEWADYLKLHASVNKTRQTAYLGAGASQSKNTLTFEFRYNPLFKDIAINTQLYRMVFDGHNYRVMEYDDYMLKHLTVKLVGESY